MKASFWHERWEQNRTGFQQDAVNGYLETHWNRVGVSTESCVLVPLCGKSLDMMWLRDQGHLVLGVELSPVAVQTFFEENGLEVQKREQGGFMRSEADGIALLCGDFFDLTTEDVKGVSGIYDRGALIALPPEMRERYAAHMANLFSGGVEALLIAVDYSQQEMNGPPFAVSEEEIRTLFGDAFEIEHLEIQDVLADHQRFKDRGLTALTESAYLLRGV